MLDRVSNRLRQTMHFLTPPRIPLEARREALGMLSPRQVESFSALSTFDQQHLLCVYNVLKGAGHENQDLLTAGLVHDIGKRDGQARVRFVDRAARVLLARVAPGLLMSLARPPATGWRSGLVLAVHHAELGAARARALGFNEHICALVRHHEASDLDTPDMLAALQRADRAC
jgi:hypothetical protein